MTRLKPRALNILDDETIRSSTEPGYVEQLTKLVDEGMPARRCRAVLHRSGRGCLLSSPDARRSFWPEMEATGHRTDSTMWCSSASRCFNDTDSSARPRIRPGHRRRDHPVVTHTADVLRKPSPPRNARSSRVNPTTSPTTSWHRSSSTSDSPARVDGPIEIRHVEQSFPPRSPPHPSTCHRRHPLRGPPPWAPWPRLCSRRGIACLSLTKGRSDARGRRA